MTTADWALGISLGSLVVSMLGFVWNVWSKFIYPKANVRTTISVMEIISCNESVRSIVALRGTNYGPTETTIYLPIMQDRSNIFDVWRGKGMGILKPLDHIDSRETSGPFSGGLPKKLGVGEEFAVYFPVTKTWFTKDELLRFGFSDIFGRHHWCSRSNAREFRRRVFEAADKISGSESGDKKTSY